MSRRWIVTLVLGLLAATSLPTNAKPAGPPVDFESPYVAILEGQLPNTHRPWQRSSAENRPKFAKAYAAGLRWTYTWVAYSDIVNPDGTYSEADLRLLDQYVRDARAEGLYLKIQVMVGPWGEPVPADPPVRVNSRHPSLTPAPATFDGIRDFWVTLVDRYRPHGTLARAERWGSYGVRHWEVENEPDSMVWTNAWQHVPKDYAEYLSVIYPAVKAVDRNAVISAPALSHQEGGDAPKGLRWLDEVLSPGGPDSEWASDTYRAGVTHPSGGPFVDAYSFHRNNPNVGNGQVPQRVADLKAVIARYVDASAYPTSAQPRVWYSEGGTLQYSGDPAKFARAQVQLQSQLLGAGVERMVWALGAEPNKPTVPWEQSPMFAAVRAFTTYFPTAGSVQRADGDVDAARVTAYRRTDPVTGLRTWVLWAHDLPDGAARREPFTVTVPARPGTVHMAGSEGGWAIESGTVDEAGVAVTLHAEDVSPVVIVAER